MPAMNIASRTRQAQRIIDYNKYSATITRMVPGGTSEVVIEALEVAVVPIAGFAVPTGVNALARTGEIPTARQQWMMLTLLTEPVIQARDEVTATNVASGEVIDFRVSSNARYPYKQECLLELVR